MVKGKKETDEVVEPVFVKGTMRSFLQTESSEDLVKKRSLKKNDYIFLLIIIVLSVNIRLSSLSVPNSVVFDEVHFGKFAKRYILGKFFMDVHPPLAKVLFAAVNLLSGFKGDFDFEKIGDVYPDFVPYVSMRLFPALLGVGTVILSYLTMKVSGCRSWVSFLTSYLLLIDNSLITISRYILLDSPLIFFIALTAYFFKSFEIQKPFTFGWYKYLIGTGVGLGLSLSSKLVGLFTIAWVGLLCLYQMWFLIGDLKVSTKKVWLHFFSRVIILLGVPIIFYLGMFAVHFQILNKDGEGSSFMSPSFRTGLKNSLVPTNIEANVGFGSIVNIKHLESGGGYLHSHNLFYPTGSKQQQITLYPHIDSNNDWLIEPYNTSITDEFIPIKSGMKVRLKHVNTGRRLHSHDEKPPVSERDWQKEVSCYGYEGFGGDANDDFYVEIVDKKTTDPDSKTYVKALTTVFRLRHVMSGNYLFAGKNKLPDWGYEQTEVTAASQGARPLTYWYIEANTNERVPANISEIAQYPTMNFLQKFVENHVKMWTLNSGLTDFHPWQSDPIEWPWVLRGISYWAKENKNIYLLGNLPVWWASIFTIVFSAVYGGIQVLRWQLGSTIGGEKHIFNFNHQAFTYLTGWLLHYMPFFLMGRQLFLHHYLPAFYFSVLCLGQYLNILVTYVGKNCQILSKVIYLGIFALTVCSSIFYYNYSPLIYGKPWVKSQCQATKLFNWDYDCNNYLDSFGDYSKIQKASNNQALPNILEPKKVKETPYKPVDKNELKRGNPNFKADKKSSKADPKSESADKKEPVEQLVPPLPDEETK
ncbi:dolichyl-phosphate-mannose--protein mannosyltransferase 1 [[Candida] jaroonii]|uniref:Dolichyl-phosphate-mannose--protein mannosyltransferase 1 n=1 Tax=[Candida] jaroonii TaxID=467808 RepID=A0ACA9Y8L7_9ASCO|nr:dolichyl-phosphate-mannose--protein mannosyltransferase 1 [[Candida] jaroonii]